MARKQLGTAPSDTTDAVTVAYFQANKSSGSSSGGGNGNVYVQQANPGMTNPGLWWQIDATGNLVTLWVETASTTVALPTSNLTYRWRAASLTGYATGNVVGNFPADTGGITLTASGTARPTYLAAGLNGQPSLVFDGSDDVMVAGSGISAPQATTTIIIFDLKALLDQQLYHAGGQEAFLNNSGATAWQAYGGSGTIAGGTPSTGGHMHMLSANNSIGTISVDGAQVATGTFGAGGWTGLTLGAHQGLYRYTQFNVSEVLVYSVDLLDTTYATQLTQLKSYVRSTYGLTVS